MSFARNMRKRAALTDEQRERARDYFFGYEGQAEWELQFTIDEIWEALKIGLELAGGEMNRHSEWGYAVQHNGLLADSIEMARYQDGYYEEFIEGMNYGKPFYGVLPEFFPGSGMWCDHDISAAFNAHMPELLEKWKLTYDAVNAYYDAYCAWENGDVPYEDYPNELESIMYDVWGDYATAHEDALNDMCAAAEKLLDESADYYYSDEAFWNWLNDFDDDEILERIGWID